MAHPTLTVEIARAAGTDAGNRSMRKAGRQRWNDDDFNVAAETTMRFTVLGGFLPVECYESGGFGQFPFYRNNRGKWVRR